MELLGIVSILLLIIFVAYGTVDMIKQINKLDDDYEEGNE
jgi:hypothetical protein